MRSHVHIRRSLASVAALLVVLLLGAATAAGAETVPGGYTGGESTEGSVDENPAPPPAVPAPPAPPPAGRLAFTGSDVVRTMAIAGGGLVLAGCIAVVAARARREPSGVT